MNALPADCVFQIMPQHNYTAHKALKKHRKKMAAKAVSNLCVRGMHTAMASPSHGSPVSGTVGNIMAG